MYFTSYFDIDLRILCLLFISKELYMDNFYKSKK